MSTGHLNTSQIQVKYEPQELACLIWLYYSEAVKNITVSLPDEVYRQARIRAAEKETSVSALVREFLLQLVAEESDFARRKRLQDETLSSVQSFRAGDRLTRDTIHQRDALR